MTGVIIGFAIIFSIVLVGYILAKTGIIASGSERLAQPHRILLRDPRPGFYGGEQG